MQTRCQIVARPAPSTLYLSSSSSPPQYCHLKFPGYAMKICSRRYLAFKSEVGAGQDWVGQLRMGLLL